MSALAGRICSSLLRGSSRSLRLTQAASLSSSALTFQQPKKKTVDTKTVTSELRNLVRTNLKFEESELDELPEVPGFKCSMNGAIATFEKTSVGGEEVKVEVDVNSSAELDLMEEPGEEEDPEEATTSVPVITVTIKKNSGHRMRLECSYGTVYDDKTDVEEIRLQVDSVCMIPPKSGDSDALYVQEATEIPEEITTCLEKYLRVQGIDSEFGADLLSFFEVYQHNVYVREFLEKLEQYCSN